MIDEVKHLGPFRVENVKIPSGQYRTFLKDQHRPPSRGGNTRAWHLHVIQIGEDRYS